MITSLKEVEFNCMAAMQGAIRPTASFKVTPRERKGQLTSRG